MAEGVRSEVTQIHERALFSCSIQHPPPSADGSRRTRHSVSVATVEKLYKVDSLDNLDQQIYQTGPKGIKPGPDKQSKCWTPGMAEIDMLYDLKQFEDE